MRGKRNRRSVHQRSLFYTPPPPPPSKTRRVGQIMLAALRRTCMTLGIMVLVLALYVFFVAGSLFGVGVIRVPDQAVLHLKFEGGFPEQPPGGLAYGIGDHNVPLRQIIDAIDLAAGDDRIHGILAEARGSAGDMAQMQELHAAIQRFRASGKFAYIYGESYNNGLGGYYIASAFDEIWMQPMGTVSIPGMRAEMPLARELLDTLGITPAFFQRREYKNIFESLERDEISPETRETLSSIVMNVIGSMTATISAARGKDIMEFSSLIDIGLLTDREALEAGLVDRLDYTDVLASHIREQVTGDPDDENLRFFNLARYARALNRNIEAAAESRDFPGVTLVYIDGAIVSYNARAQSDSSLLGDSGAVAEDIAAAIRRAARDHNTRAIVLRVNSPGGSPTASETIRRAVVFAQGRGKPVYVSMGGMAASGGYWVSTDADRIYALPMTLTGSIGVAGGKIVLQDMWDKIGVNWDNVSYGRNAGIWSPNAVFTESEAERMNAMMDMVYDGFVSRVAEGRGMSVEEAENVARGRVWTGTQAKDHGLVDEMGSLSGVLDEIARELGQPDRFHLALDIRPRPRTPFEQLMRLMGAQARAADMLNAQAVLLKPFEPMIERMSVAAGQDVLTYEPMQLK